MKNKKKILLLTISHIWYDTRLYYKIIKSLLKKDVEILYITGNPKDNLEIIKNENLIVDNTTLNSAFAGSYYGKIKLVKSFIQKGLKYLPDIVICVEPLTLIAGFILKKKLNCRLVYDSHEYYIDAFKERYNKLSFLYQKCENYYARKTDAIITVNDILINYYKELNPNTYLCANYQNYDLFSDKKYKKTNDIIYVGSLYFERGLKDYLQLAQIFKDNDQKVKMKIIGNFKNPSTELYFHNYIKVKQLGKIIKYQPYTPHDIVLREIRKSKIGIFFADINQSPRYNKAINMKIFEYMSQSVPVVVNQLDILSDFVIKSDGGWVTKNITDLYDLLIKVLNDDSMLIKKGESGYKYILENHLWENQEQTLYKAIFGDS
jgi:glycosyltransferase involved in cell wall biosynthesis